MRKALLVGAALMFGALFPQTVLAQWTTTAVDVDGDVGLYTSIALDTFGRPCISYLDDTNSRLKLACWNEDTWAIWEVPELEIPAGAYSALAIDSTGNIHIAYRLGDQVYSVLKYARWDGASWWLDTVDNQAQGVGHNNSIALDSTSAPHIAYLKKWGQNTVKYARWTGSAWEPKTVYNPSGDYYLGDVSLALDSGDHPWIAIQAWGDDAGLELAHLAGRKWKVDTVDPEGDGDFVSLAIDANDARHIVYTDNPRWDEVLPYDLRYSNLDGSANAELIDFNEDNEEPFGEISLALDSAGNPHLTYYDANLAGDSTPGALLYAYRSGTSWTIEIVNDVGDVGRYSSLVLDDSDNPHISYYDATNGSLMYATKGAEECGNDSCGVGESPCNCETDCGTPPAVEDPTDLTECSDGIDNDCDGLVDANDDTDCCPDLDDDGFTSAACPFVGPDCDDNNALVFPEGPESSYCDDGLDNDCNGWIDCVDWGCSESQVCIDYCDSYSSAGRRVCNALEECRWDNRNKVCVTP